jgi:hypothetical protein
MLQLISPQTVREMQEGYVVQVVDRYHVAYEHRGRTATVDVDFGPTVGIYSKTLRGWKVEDGHCAGMTSRDKREVVARIVECLQFMGCLTDVIDEGQNDPCE